jgi:hypothetical protein
MVQDKAANFMKEEVIDDDDCIQWAADAKQHKQKPTEERNPGQALVL